MSVIGFTATLTIGAVSVDEATTITLSGVMADAVEDTHLGTASARTFIGGLVNSGTVSWSANYDSTTFSSLHALVGTTASCEIESPTSEDQSFTFDAVVTKLDTSFSSPDLVLMNGELQISGDITLGSIGS